VVRLKPLGREPFGHELKAEWLGAERLFRLMTEGVKKERLSYLGGNI
jgi:hypothetical protein